MTAVLPTYARFDIAFDRGEGAWLMTKTGERYLDFASGVAVNALGHANPRLIAALTEQAHKVWHVSNLYNIEGQQRLAERLCANSFADKVFFCNSGAEAIEGAIKTARRYHYAKGNPERWRTITFEGAFHGRTIATIAAGGQPKYLEGFGLKADGFDQIPFGDHEALKAAIGPHTAAILIEPIQGEGGLRSVPAQCLQGLRELCDAQDLLLIFDEVQCGMGRTGHLFAYEAAGVAPDIMGIAKALGGGMPIGAVLATDKAAAGMVAGTHGSTFGGNPLATAVGNAVLDAMLEPGFLDHVRQMSLLMKQQLAGIVDEFPDLVQEVRGEGLLSGLKLKVPSGDVVKALLAEKLLSVGAGDNVVRLLPPLIVTPGELRDAATRIATALRKVRAASKSIQTVNA